MLVLDVIINKVMMSDIFVIIVVIGFFMNVVMVLICELRIVEYIEFIILMGGGIFGNWMFIVEFNIWVDVEVVKCVFESGIIINVFGLDVIY